MNRRPTYKHVLENYLFKVLINWVGSGSKKKSGSDFLILKFLLQYILRYRSLTIEKQLKTCFPLWTPTQLKKTVDDYYSHLTWLLIEVASAFKISPEQMASGYHITGVSSIKNSFLNNTHVIILAGHIGNWEWGLQSITHHLNLPVYGIYKPLKNPLMEDRIKKFRSRSGIRLISYKDFIRRVKISEKPAIFFILSDQYSGQKKRSISIPFFNQPTYFDTSVYQFLQNQTVEYFYAHVIKSNAFKYECLIQPMSIKNPDSFQETAVKYAMLLEKNIRQQPEIWLWSHRRWK